MSKKPEPNFTLDEANAEMAQKMLDLYMGKEQDDPGLTTRELAQLWGVSTSTARARVQEMTGQGKYIRGHKTAIDAEGRPRRVRVYRPKESEEEGGEKE